MDNFDIKKFEKDMLENEKFLLKHMKQFRVIGIIALVVEFIMIVANIWYNFRIKFLPLSLALIGFSLTRINSQIRKAECLIRATEIALKEDKENDKV